MHASREARTRSVPARPGLAGRGLRLACILAGVFHAIASDPTLQSVAALELEFRSTNLAGSASLDCGLCTQCSVARSLEPLSQFSGQFGPPAPTEHWLASAHWALSVRMGAWAPRALVGQQCRKQSTLTSLTGCHHAFDTMKWLVVGVHPHSSHIHKVFEAIREVTHNETYITCLKCSSLLSVPV